MASGRFAHSAAVSILGLDENTPDHVTISRTRRLNKIYVANIDSNNVTVIGGQATFQSTLADINNDLAVGLIDNQGIASALSSEINAAANAAARGDNTTSRNILNAFINQVDAQAGKHIKGNARQVLLEDAKSLLSQLNEL